MKKYLAISFGIAMLVNACDGNSGTVYIAAQTDQHRPGGTVDCSDDCKPDDVKCQDGSILRCGYYDTDECLDWSDGEKCECGCDGKACKADCPAQDKCTSNCVEAGNTKCSGSNVLTCTEVEKDCLQWSEPKKCSDGKTCILGKCDVSETGCTNECDENDVECTASGRRQCVVGTDKCTVWKDIEACADDENCSSGKCQKKGADVCTLGDKECDGKGWHECIKGSDGFTVWGDIHNCKDTETCQDAACIALGSDKCENGKKECSGNGFHECVKGSSGFTDWSAVTPCGEKQKCEGGACIDKCTDACTSGKTKCSDDSKGIIKCETGSDGCLVWGSASSCEYGCESDKCKSKPTTWVPECSSNCPTVIESFPYVVTHDNSGSQNVISTYTSCGNQDESGPENSYIFKVDEPGYLIAGVMDKGSKDVDIQLLTALDANSCLERNDKYVMKHINSGIYYITVDSYAGAANSGSYQLAVQFLADSGTCGLTPTSVARVGGRSTVNLPAIGNVVLEAHLVTVHDRQVIPELKSTNEWPDSYTEYIDQHRDYTKSLYPEYIKKQTEPWCPSGEGGCSYGQGSAVNAVPDDAEAWYICMYWTSASKPKPGTRFLVLDPLRGKAVVAAAGYETGPGDENKIGGAVDEIHHYFGSAGDSPRHIMFSQMTTANQNLPFGPITCKYPK